jgi:ASC-1-like (ASCH) protein
MKIYPKNKKHFLELVNFSREILSICKKAGARPIIWGGLAYFYYTKDKNYNIGDFDFLIPKKCQKKIMKLLDEKSIRYKFLKNWDLIIIKRGKLKIELDSIKRYYKNKKSKKININGIKIDIVNLDSLIKMYKKASIVSKDNPKEYYKKYKKLISL